MYNPCIRGWITYYSHFYKTQLRPTLRRIDAYLIRWSRRKFKRMRHRTKGKHAVRTAARGILGAAPRSTFAIDHAAAACWFSLFHSQGSSSTRRLCRVPAMRASTSANQPNGSTSLSWRCQAAYSWPRPERHHVRNQQRAMTCVPEQSREGPEEPRAPDARGEVRPTRRRTVPIGNH